MTRSGRTSPLQQFPPDPDVKLDLSYVSGKGSPAQSLDLYLPKGAQPGLPLMVYVHGGAWIGGDKTLYRFFGEGFRKEGFAVAILNYRLSAAGKFLVPSHAEDCAQAIAFLAANKAQYPYDPKKIFLVGHSAGAHTIAYLAADGSLFKKAGVPDECLPKGYVGMEGIYDVPAIYKAHPDYKAWFLEAAFGAEKNWAKASPTLMPISSRAPWVVVHSTGDNLVDLDQSSQFQAHLKKAGVPADMVVVDGLNHDAVVVDSLREKNQIHVAILGLIKR